MNVSLFRKSIFKGLFLLSMWTIGIKATPIFQISTLATQLFVSTGSSVTATYTVKNNTHIDITQIKYLPSAGTTVASSSTCGSSLAQGASCQVAVTFHATQQAGTVPMTLTVCAEQQQLCSTTNAANRIKVAVRNAQLAKLYVTNYGNNTVSICSINTDGTVNSCTAVDPGNTFNGPSGIAANPLHTLLYVTNFFAGTVSICPVNSDGTLSTCTSVNPGGTFNGPSDLTVNAAGTILYVTNYANNTLSICPINSDGTLATCTAVNPGNTFSSPDDLVLNTTNTIAYVTNTGTSTVSICPVDSQGNLDACTAFNPGNTFNQPGGITINAFNSVLYVNNANIVSNNVAICSLNADGTFGTCTTHSDPTFLITFGKNALNTANTILYVANEFSIPPAGVSVCPVNSNGTLNACLSSRDASFETPEGLILLP